MISCSAGGGGDCGRKRQKPSIAFKPTAIDHGPDAFDASSGGAAAAANCSAAQAAGSGWGGASKKSSVETGWGRLSAAAVSAPAAASAADVGGCCQSVLNATSTASDTTATRPILIDDGRANAHRCEAVSKSEGKGWGGVLRSKSSGNSGWVHTAAANKDSFGWGKANNSNLTVGHDAISSASQEACVLTTAVASKERAVEGNDVVGDTAGTATATNSLRSIAVWHEEMLAIALASAERVRGLKRSSLFCSATVDKDCIVVSSSPNPSQGLTRPL